MCLVSSQGVSSASIFGYMKTLGRREDEFSGLGFAHLCIARPGPIDRHELAKARLKERIMHTLLPHSAFVNSSEVGLVLVRASERHRAGSEGSKVKIFEHAELKS